MIGKAKQKRWILVVRREESGKWTLDMGVKRSKDERP